MTVKTRRFYSVAAFVAGVAIAIAAGVYAQAGYPTRPRFNSVGIGTGAPTTNGELSQLGNVNTTFTHLIDNDSNGTGNAARVAISSGDTNVALFAGGSGRTSPLVTNGPNGQSAALRTLGTVPLLFATNNTLAGEFQGDGVLRLYGVGSVGGTINTSLSLPNAGAIRALDSGGTNVRHLISLWSDDNIYVGHASHVLDLNASALEYNNAVITPQSGTFTLSYTNGCSTTPTQAARYAAFGNLVTITVAAAFTCAGDTTVFDTDAGDIPAGIRPVSSNVYGPHVGANNNGTSVTAMVEIATNGEVIVNRCGAVTGTCDGGAWTGSGNRGLDAWTVSYVRQ